MIKITVKNLVLIGIIFILQNPVFGDVTDDSSNNDSEVNNTNNHEETAADNLDHINHKHERNINITKDNTTMFANNFTRIKTNNGTEDIMKISNSTLKVITRALSNLEELPDTSTITTKHKETTVKPDREKPKVINLKIKPYVHKRKNKRINANKLFRYPLQHSSLTPSQVINLTKSSRLKNNKSKENNNTTTRHTITYANNTEQDNKIDPTTVLPTTKQNKTTDVIDSKENKLSTISSVLKEDKNGNKTKNIVTANNKTSNTNYTDSINKSTTQSNETIIKLMSELLENTYGNNKSLKKNKTLHMLEEHNITQQHTKSKGFQKIKVFSNTKANLPNKTKTIKKLNAHIKIINNKNNNTDNSTHYRRAKVKLPNVMYKNTTQNNIENNNTKISNAFQFRFDIRPRHKTTKSMKPRIGNQTAYYFRVDYRPNNTTTNMKTQQNISELNTYFGVNEESTLINNLNMKQPKSKQHPTISKHFPLQKALLDTINDFMLPTQNPKVTSTLEITSTKESNNNYTDTVSQMPFVYSVMNSTKIIMTKDIDDNKDIEFQDFLQPMLQNISERTKEYKYLPFTLLTHTTKKLDYQPYNFLKDTNDLHDNNQQYNATTNITNETFYDNQILPVNNTDEDLDNYNLSNPSQSNTTKYLNIYQPYNPTIYADNKEDDRQYKVTTDNAFKDFNDYPLYSSPVSTTVKSLDGYKKTYNPQQSDATEYLNYRPYPPPTFKNNKGNHQQHKVLKDNSPKYFNDNQQYYLPAATTINDRNNHNFYSPSQSEYSNIYEYQPQNVSSDNNEEHYKQVTPNKTHKGLEVDQHIYLPAPMSEARDNYNSVNAIDTEEYSNIFPSYNPITFMKGKEDHKQYNVPASIKHNDFNNNQQFYSLADPTEGLNNDNVYNPSEYSNIYQLYNPSTFTNDEYYPQRTTTASKEYYNNYHPFNLSVDNTGYGNLTPNNVTIANKLHSDTDYVKVKIPKYKPKNHVQIDEMNKPTESNEYFYINPLNSNVGNEMILLEKPTYADFKQPSSNYEYPLNNQNINVKDKQVDLFDDDINFPNNPRTELPYNLLAILDNKGDISQISNIGRANSYKPLLTHIPYYLPTDQYYLTQLPQNEVIHADVADIDNNIYDPQSYLANPNIRTLVPYKKAGNDIKYIPYILQDSQADTKYFPNLERDGDTVILQHLERKPTNAYLPFDNVVNSQIPYQSEAQIQYPYYGRISNANNNIPSNLQAKLMNNEAGEPFNFLEDKEPVQTNTEDKHEPVFLPMLRRINKENLPQNLHNMRESDLPIIHNLENTNVHYFRKDMYEPPAGMNSFFLPSTEDINILPILRRINKEDLPQNLHNLQASQSTHVLANPNLNYFPNVKYNTPIKTNVSPSTADINKDQSNYPYTNTVSPSTGTEGKLKATPCNKDVPRYLNLLADSENKEVVKNPKPQIDRTGDQESLQMPTGAATDILLDNNKEKNYKEIPINEKSDEKEFENQNPDAKVDKEKKDLIKIKYVTKNPIRRLNIKDINEHLLSKLQKLLTEKIRANKNVYLGNLGHYTVEIIQSRR